MRHVKDVNNEYIFNRVEWLGVQQWKYLFARFAKEKKDGILTATPAQSEIEEVSFSHLCLDTLYQTKAPMFFIPGTNESAT